MVDATDRLFKKRIRFMEEDLQRRVIRQDELTQTREESFSEYGGISEQVTEHMHRLELQFEDKKIVQRLKVDLGKMQAQIEVIKTIVKNQDSEYSELERMTRNSLQLLSKENSSNRNIQNSNVIDTIDLDTDIAEDTDLHSVQQQLSDTAINSDGPTIEANNLLMDIGIDRLGPSTEPTTWASTSTTNASTSLDPGSTSPHPSMGSQPECANRSSPPMPSYQIPVITQQRTLEPIEDSNPAGGPRSPPNARRSRSSSRSNQSDETIGRRSGDLEEPVVDWISTVDAGSSAPVDPSQRAPRFSRPRHSSPDQPTPPNWSPDQADYSNRGRPNGTCDPGSRHRSRSRSQRRPSWNEDTEAHTPDLVGNTSPFLDEEVRDRRLDNLKRRMSHVFMCKFTYGMGLRAAGTFQPVHCDLNLKYSLASEYCVDRNDNTGTIRTLPQPKVIQIGWGGCFQVSVNAVKRIQLKGDEASEANWVFDIHLVNLRYNPMFDKNRIILGSDFLKRYLMEMQGARYRGQVIFEDKLKHLYKAPFVKKNRLQ